MASGYCRCPLSVGTLAGDQSRGRLACIVVGQSIIDLASNLAIGRLGSAAEWPNGGRRRQVPVPIICYKQRTGTAADYVDLDERSMYQSNFSGY